MKRSSWNRFLLGSPWSTIHHQGFPFLLHPGTGTLLFDCLLLPPPYHLEGSLHEPYRWQRYSIKRETRGWSYICCHWLHHLAVTSLDFRCAITIGWRMVWQVPFWNFYTKLQVRPPVHTLHAWKCWLELVMETKAGNDSISNKKRMSQNCKERENMSKNGTRKIEWPSKLTGIPILFAELFPIILPIQEAWKFPIIGSITFESKCAPKNAHCFERDTWNLNLKFVLNDVFSMEPFQKGLVLSTWPKFANRILFWQRKGLRKICAF